MRHSLARQGGQTLIIIFFGMLLFGGSALVGGVFATGKSVSQLRKDVKGLVQDAARREQADRVLQDWEKTIAGYVDQRRDSGKSFLGLLARHDAGREEFDRLFAGIDAGNHEAVQQLLKQRAALRARLTAEEWRQLFPAPAPAAEKP